MVSHGGWRRPRAATSDEPLAAAVDEKRRLDAHLTRVVVRLRQSDTDAAAPWVSEIVCFLFNTQGEVLRIHRASDGRAKPPPLSSATEQPFDGDTSQDDNKAVSIRSFCSNEATEKQRLVLALPALDPAVEVVGVLVSYPTDLIAKRPRLNGLTVAIDATDSSGDDHSLASWECAPSLRLYAHTHAADPTASNTAGSANYVVLCKLYRDTDNRSGWVFHGIGGCGEVRSSVNAALAEAMQVFLLDIIPEIEIAHRNALNTVASICAALSRSEVLDIERYFRDEGVTRDEFVKLLLLVLLQSRPELQRLSRATALVALLFEMFEQIDINGDGAVDWEEFTTFCVSLGLIATKEQTFGGSVFSGCTYQQQLVGSHDRTFPYQLRRIRELPHLHLMVVIQNKCSILLMYDAGMTLLYEFNQVSRLSREENSSLAILDVDYIQMRNWLVVSSSDQLLTFWSVVNATAGAFVFAFKIGSRCPILDLQWCGSSLNRLVTLSSEGVQLWDVDARRVVGRLNHHRDRITACQEIQTDESLLATSSFDTTIAVLRIPSLAPAFELRGHSQGVRQMDYHTQGGILLSSGFEHQGYVWSIANRSLLTTLGGHQASLIGARFVSHLASTTAAMVVTGDERGHFRLWDVSRCLGRHTADLATALQTFEIVTPNLCKYRTFACGTMPSSSLSCKTDRHDRDQELVDVVSGSFRLVRFDAVTHNDEVAPPRHVVFNSISNCFVGCVDGVITVWSAHSGSKTEEPFSVRDADVCAIAFDMPRQRKLFVATSDGAIRLYNPITAVMLTCLVSTGFDRRIAVSYSSAGKTDVDILRTIENAHDLCISAAAYSQQFELIATGDDGGNLHVYDFQRLYLLFRCEGHTDQIRALHFHHSAPLLVSADATGAIFLWGIAVSGSTYQIQPLMQLTLSCTNGFLIQVRPLSRTGSRPSTTCLEPSAIIASPVTSIVSTPESKHNATSYIYVGTTNGDIWGWDFRVLTNYARKCGVGKAFEYRFNDERGTSTGSSNHNALLRVTHKTSVLKLRTDDPATLQTPVWVRAGKDAAPADVLQSCEATCVWQAHSATVAQLHVLSHPGQIYSVSLDGSIKVWDAGHAAIGVITTVPAREPPIAPTASALSSTWKFSIQRSKTHGSRDQHIRIAREMLRRAERRRKREPHQQDKHDGTDGEYADEAEGGPVQADPLELTRTLATAEKVLANEIAFSKGSRRAGLQTGLFGAEEARLLRELAAGPRMQHEKLVKSRLAPLMLASPKQDHRSKQLIRLPGGNEIELPVMRTMRHFPAEMERKRRLDKRENAHRDMPDTAMPRFLQEKLQFALSRAQPKSTPKKTRLPHRLLNFAMDGSVAVTENVALPLLRGDRSQPTLAEASAEAAKAVPTDCHEKPMERTMRLALTASAPTLPVDNHANIAVEYPPPSAGHVNEEMTTENGAHRSNVARKMRIYEELGNTRMSTKPEGWETNDSDQSDEKALAHSQLVRHHRRLQPELAIRQKADAEALGNGNVPPRKQLSQGSVPTSCVETVASNPFGPHYTPKQVVDFSGIIARFDSDYSGDIDKSEWVRMMQSCRPIFGSLDLEAAERLFHSIDRDDSGKISLQEILPMVVRGIVDSNL